MLYNLSRVCSWGGRLTGFRGPFTRLSPSGRGGASEGLGSTPFACPRLRAIRPFLTLTLLSCLSGCPVLDGNDILSNTTDPTNNSADYLGSPTCQACHPGVGAVHQRHGHSQILKRTQGTAPVYSSALPQAGVPDAPPGSSFDDLGFIIGGYTRAAQFVDRDGYLLTETTTGDPIQYNLGLIHAGSQAGFVALSGPTQTTYAFDCFRCHTTGAQSLAAGGLREDNRPGIDGAWALDAVQCEACHGPGSNHVPNPGPGNIFLDPTSATCTGCHSGGTGRIAARNGFITGHQQTEELGAGPHAAFNCTICHDPHASVFADRDRAIRNDCRSCHSTMNMALHEGKVYTQGNYTETLTCQSCHMPYAGRYAQSAAPEYSAGLGRIGDSRTHIVFIDTQNHGFAGMFTADGGAVVRDAAGQAAVTVDFVCLRCHNGLGNVFDLSVSTASEIAEAIHTPP